MNSKDQWYLELGFTEKQIEEMRISDREYIKDNMTRWLYQVQYWMGFYAGRKTPKTYSTIGELFYFKKLTFGWGIHQRGKTVYIHISSEDDSCRSILNADEFTYDLGRGQADSCHDIIEDMLCDVFPGIKQMSAWAKCEVMESDHCATRNLDKFTVCHEVGIYQVCNSCEGLLAKRLQGNDESGYVYLIGNTGAGYFKIGFSKEPIKRIVALKNEMPFPIGVLHQIVVDNMREAESLLHDQFKDKHSNGEWYTLSQEDVTYIRNLAYYANGSFVSKN